MDEKLDLILKELRSLTTRLDTFEQNTNNNFSDVKGSIDKLSEKIAVQHIENINADNLLLSEIRSIREGVVFVNRKVADAELELNLIKQSTKQ